MKSLIGICLLVCVVLASCRKDSETFGCVSERLFDLKNECQSLREVSTADLRFNPTSSISDLIENPSYELSNPNRIAYIKNEKYLVLFDKTTGKAEFESQELSTITSRPDWSENGIICFSSIPTGQIYFFDTKTSEWSTIPARGSKSASWINTEEIVFAVNQGRYGWH